MNIIKKKLYEVLELALEPAKQPDIKATQSLDLSLAIRKEGVNVIQIQSIANSQIALGIVQVIKMIDEMKPAEAQDIIQILAFNEASWEEAQKQFSIKYLKMILDRCFGNQTEAAKVLGINRTYISRLARKYLQ